jgi:hypothetical protein
LLTFYYFHLKKIITTMPAGAKYDAWAAAKFQPEEDFLEALSQIPGITKIDTQTYTIMPMYRLHSSVPHI